MDQRAHNNRHSFPSVLFMLPALLLLGLCHGLHAQSVNTFQIDDNGGWTFLGPDGTALTASAPRIEIDGQRFAELSLVSHASDNGVQQMTFQDPDGLHLVLTIRTSADHPDTLTCDALITNGSDADITISRIIPVTLSLPDATPHSKLMVMGAYLHGSGILEPQHLPARSFSHTLWAPGDHGCGVFLGFDTFAKSFSYVDLTSDSDAVLAAATCDYRRFDSGNSELSDGRLTMAVTFTDRGGAVVPSGGRLQAETVSILYGPDPLSLAEQWADAMAARYHTPRLKQPIGAFETWTHWVGPSDEQTVLRMTDFIVSSGLRDRGVDYFQIDHAWSFSRTSFHSEDAEKFPHGMKWLADELASKGMKLGLWISPFARDEKSEIYTQHPEYLVRNDDGELHKVFWGYVTDITQTAAQDMVVGDLKRLMNDWGIKQIWYDGPTDSFTTGNYANLDKMTLMEAYHATWKRILSEVDDFVVAGSSMAGIGVGHLDVMYLGPDVGQFTDKGYIQTWGSILRYTQESANKWYYNGRLYWSLPGGLSVKPSATSYEQAISRATVVGLTGGAIFITDPLDELDEDRLALIKKVLPPYPLTTRPIDLFDAVRLQTGHDSDVVESTVSDVSGQGPAGHNNPPRIWFTKIEKPFGTWYLLALYNWSEQQPIDLSVPLQRLGLPADQTFLAYDRWKQNFLGPVNGTINAQLPPASVQLLALYPQQNVPQILGTDYHITGGGPDLADVQWDPQSQILSGTSTAVPGEPYHITIHLPEGYGPVDDSHDTPSVTVPFTIPDTGTLHWRIPLQMK